MENMAARREENDDDVEDAPLMTRSAYFFVHFFIICVATWLRAPIFNHIYINGVNDSVAATFVAIALVTW